ncbi:c-type cytochrome [Pseudomonas citronellolis]|uniref:c-type cytochrome n=1 Tax=Pseudomonas citronellolis TaxID=53408 RepID=UPI002D1E47D5|nr:c-type cytochrome [Pseudomonas citronellolis]
MMKKLLIIGVVAAVVVSSAIFIPPLVEGYRFMHTLAAQDAENEAHGGPWPQIQDTCVGCHGFRGQSRNARYAALAGQDAAYLEAQLAAFADGRRRHSPQMSPLALKLKDDQVKHLATYFSRQPAVQVEVPRDDQKLAQQGQALVEARGCAGCHAPGLSGGLIGPRIAGLGDVYLGDQLLAFKEGRRSDPSGAMNALASSFSPEDIRAISHYVATLAPKSQGTPKFTVR